LVAWSSHEYRQDITIGRWLDSSLYHIQRIFSNSHQDYTTIWQVVLLAPMDWFVHPSENEKCLV